MSEDKNVQDVDRTSESTDADRTERPEVRVLGSLEELTKGGNQPITDGMVGAS